MRFNHDVYDPLTSSPSYVYAPPSYNDAPYTEHFLVMAHVAVTHRTNATLNCTSAGFDTSALDAALLSVLGRPGSTGNAEDEAVGPDVSRLLGSIAASASGCGKCVY